MSLENTIEFNVNICYDVDYCSNKDYKDLLIAYLDKNLNTTIDYQ